MHLLVLSALSAFAADGVIPVQGFISDATGMTATGARPVTFRIYGGAGANLIAHEETLMVDFDAGLFSVLLGAADEPLDLAVFADPTVNWIAVEYGGAESPKSRLGSAARAAWAQRAALADDATRLGDVSAATYLTEHELGAGLGLSGAHAVVNPGSGLQITGDDVTFRAGDGLGFTAGGEARVNVGDGLQISGDAIAARVGAGLRVDAGSLAVDLGAGLTLSGTQLRVDNAAIAPGWTSISGRPAWLSEATEGAFEGRVEGYLANGGVTVGGAVKIGPYATDCGSTTRGQLSYHAGDLWLCKATGWVQVTGYVPPIFQVYPSAHRRGSDPDLWGNESWGSGTPKYARVRYDSILVNSVPGAFTLNADYSVTVNQAGWYEVEMRTLSAPDAANWMHIQALYSDNNGASYTHWGWLNHGPSANVSSSWRDYYGQRKGYFPAGARIATDMYSGANSSFMYHSGNTNQDYTYMRITRLDRP